MAFANGTLNDAPVATLMLLSDTPVAENGASVPRLTAGRSLAPFANVAMTLSFWVMKLTWTVAVPVPATPARTGDATSAAQVSATRVPASRNAET